MNKGLCLLLTIVLMVTTIVPSGFAARVESYSDLPDDWSRVSLEKAISNGLLIGNRGMIRPKDNLTRAEMASIINRAFGNSMVNAMEEFDDVKNTDWFFNEMGKAVHMGLFIGSGDRLLRPNDPITREEAFVVLARALDLLDNSNSKVKRFEDEEKISRWAIDSIKSMVSNGYVNGSEGFLNPKYMITRAEFAQVMDNVIKVYISEDVDFKEYIEGNVMINTPIKSIKNLVIEGDLIIGEGVLDSELNLDNVIVKGRILVRGAKKILFNGEVYKVVVLANNIEFMTDNGDIGQFVVKGNNFKIEVDSRSKINNMHIYGTKTKVEGSGAVSEIFAYGKDISIHTYDTSVTAMDDSSGILALNRVVSTGKTVITRKPQSTSSSREDAVQQKEQVVKPVANPPAGIVEDGTLVSLTTSTSGASIYYTTDGSNPLATSIEYTSPIAINVDKTIKAIGIKEGMETSNILIANYILGVPSDFAGGSGASADPYKVQSAEQLNKVRNYLEAHFIQIADIDLGVSPWSDGDGWEPIGDDENKFAGSYNGNSYEIDGLTIDRPSQDYMGLFGYTSGAEITKISLINTDITGNKYVGSLIGFAKDTDTINCDADVLVEGLDRFTGGLIGYNEKGLIENVNIEGKVVGSEYSTGGITGENRGVIRNTNVKNMTINGVNDVGGIAGRSYPYVDYDLYEWDSNTGIITDSFAKENTFVYGDSSVGGLVGDNSGSIPTYFGIVKKSYSLATVEGRTRTGVFVGANSGKIIESFSNGYVEGDSEIGGFVGYNYGFIENCYSTSEVNGISQTGGLVGRNTDDILNCYNIGKVTGSGSQVGGLLGYLQSGSVNSCYWDTETSKLSTSAAGTGYTTYSMTMKTNSVPIYVDWDFDNIWDIEQGESYPYLRWQSAETIPYPPSDFAGGSGASADPYKVETAEQLNKVRNYLDAHFIQIADIDLGVSPWSDGDGWAPIGDSSNPFIGAYDGNGYSITNLFINKPTISYVGLFGSNQGSLISIGVKDVDVTGDQYVGGLCGMNASDASRYYGSIVNSFTTGEVIGNQFVGGLAGGTPGNYLQVTKSFSTASVRGIRGIGGLVGMMYGRITDCYSTGDVTGTTGSYRIGGLVGEPYGNIANCYSTGAVVGSSQVGGLLGSKQYEPISSYYNTETSGQIDTGNGVPLTMAEMVDRVNYTNWDFDNIWDIDSNPYTYPFFKWQTDKYPEAGLSSPEIIGHWSFDEGEGTVAGDISGNDKNGTVNGALWTTDRDDLDGKALKFGQNMWVDIPDTLKPETITLSAWIFITGTDPSAAPIFSAEKGAGATDFSYRLQITPDYKLRMEARAPYTTTGARVSTSDSSLDSNRWYHVAGTYDGITTKLYIDGELVESDGHGNYAVLNTGSGIPVGLGHLDGWSVQWFRGKIDDARIYEGALTSTEIEEISGNNN